MSAAALFFSLLHQAVCSRFSVDLDRTRSFILGVHLMLHAARVKRDWNGGTQFYLCRLAVVYVIVQYSTKVADMVPSQISSLSYELMRPQTVSS